MQFTRDNLLTPAEVSLLLGAAEKTLANWRCERTGPPFLKVGRNVIYSRASVERWLDRQEAARMKEFKQHDARNRT